eukprot:c9106_g1_i1.p1 GENE.c9106_g1_i1~~c9106_g1_i1.p1  ORF type:complete len:798 (-),score=197.35 c9106_g1_i1:5-2098(-)
MVKNRLGDRTFVAFLLFRVFPDRTVTLHVDPRSGKFLFDSRKPVATTEELLTELKQLQFDTIRDSLKAILSPICRISEHLHGVRLGKYAPPSNCSAHLFARIGTGGHGIENAQSNTRVLCIYILEDYTLQMQLITVAPRTQDPFRVVASVDHIPEYLSQFTELPSHNAAFQNGPKRRKCTDSSAQPSRLEEREFDQFQKQLVQVVEWCRLQVLREVITVFLDKHNIPFKPSPTVPCSFLVSIPTAVPAKSVSITADLSRGICLLLEFEPNVLPRWKCSEYSLPLMHIGPHDSSPIQRDGYCVSFSSTQIEVVVAHVVAEASDAMKILISSLNCIRRMWALCFQCQRTLSVCATVITPLLITLTTPNVELPIHLTCCDGVDIDLWFSKPKLMWPKCWPFWQRLLNSAQQGDANILDLLDREVQVGMALERVISQSIVSPSRWLALPKSSFVMRLQYRGITSNVLQTVDFRMMDLIQVIVSRDLRPVMTPWQLETTDDIPECIEQVASYFNSIDLLDGIKSHLTTSKRKVTFTETSTSLHVQFPSCFVVVIEVHPIPISTVSLDIEPLLMMPQEVQMKSFLTFWNDRLTENKEGWTFAGVCSVFDLLEADERLRSPLLRLALMNKMLVLVTHQGEQAIKIDGNSISFYLGRTDDTPARRIVIQKTNTTLRATMMVDAVGFPIAEGDEMAVVNAIYTRPC